MVHLEGDQVAAWRAYNGTPWGRLRLDLLWAQLEERVNPFPPANVLDVGCGLGETAIRLAAEGSAVIAVDPAPEMISAGRANAAHAGVQVTWMTLPIEELEHELRGLTFDLVCCHNVLGYVPDPAAACFSLASVLGDLGHLSVVIGNRLAEPLVAAVMRHDLGAALAAVTSGGHVGRTQTFDSEVRLVDLEEISDWFGKSGLEVEGWFGVRTVNDYVVGADDLKSDPQSYRDLLELELKLSELDPYRQIGRMLHVIGRRRRSTN